MKVAILLSVFLAIINRRQVGKLFEHFSESINVVIAGFVSYFINGFVARFQLFFCEFHLYALDVFGYRISSTFFEFALESSSSN